ncbi:YitT family protein [Serinibacter arcticus]|uniref:Arginine/ornithine antiporter ArcD n=1 Tax=Serinibacter arcticus TaxID=1655435 RepID=A0A4Z1DX85_9MICO|nr:YitT family protein [Serinibacter arcticus]TGO04174.1 Arginine/ornithine antiporter ArcD [Serinibacter arcticus]
MPTASSDPVTTPDPVDLPTDPTDPGAPTPRAATSPYAEAGVVLRHSVVEDVFGILTGAFIASLGLNLLQAVDAVTGGTAGLALLLSYALPIPFGVLFFAVNIPFFLLALRAKGWGFTARSATAVALAAVLASLHPFAGLADTIGLALHPVYAILTGNLLAGVGLLMLFRHRASLGGFNILALTLQERLGWSAGYVQMGLDVAVVLLALTVVAPQTVLLSAAGAVVLSLVLVLNHKPGRYLGT